MSKKTFLISNSDCTDIVKEIMVHMKEGVRFFTFKGDLGAGKTTCIQQLLFSFGVQNVVSPTYVIAKVYDISFETYTKLVHIDAYRIQNEEELQTLGIQRYIDDEKTIICLEWPEKCPSFIPKVYTEIHIEHISLNERSFTVIKNS